VETFWIALTAIGTILLVVVGVWQILSGRRGSRERERHEHEAQERSARDKKEELERAEQARAPKLSVREAGGFSGRERDVESYAEVLNDGGSVGGGAVVEAIIDGAVIAASAPVDVAPGATERIALAIPRQFIENLAGERPRYRGEMALRLAA